MNSPIFCLMGPTASGKTGIACQLVQRFPLEIISVDSALIYREMDIGTAKPSKAELQQFPHYLIDIVNPDESYSAASFCEDVKNLVIKIRQQGKWPLLVGGTMMYFNALQKGLSVLPEADLALRIRLQERVALHGWDFMYQSLQACDPESAARIHAHDTQRILRALEVFELTGQPLSALWKAEHSILPDAAFINIALFPQRRAFLHERIAQRFDSMLEAGLLKELRELMEKWHLNSSHPSLRCVGYRQAYACLMGEYDEKMLREKGIAATRQLAKRQLTWLRSWENIFMVDPEDPDCLEQITHLIGQHL